ncbi:MAG: hypothetical protein WC966_00185 [Bradymonadales bacterium]|jgi:hypothetical protein
MWLRVGALVVALAVFAGDAFGQEELILEKLYNFDDMLIDGEFRTPQGMFEQARAESEFDGVLNLTRTYLERVQADVQEQVMRP